MCTRIGGMIIPQMVSLEFFFGMDILEWPACLGSKPRGHETAPIGVIRLLFAFYLIAFTSFWRVPTSLRDLSFDTP